jgi:hypothetical protein
MVLNLGHDMVDDDERIAAIEFMADDLAALTTAVTTVKDLAERHAEGSFRVAYVARAAREMLES